MKHIKNGIKTFFKSLGQEQENRYFLVEDLWKKTAGSDVYKNTKIEQIKDNTIVISAKNAAWKNELHYLKKELLKKLNKKKNKEIFIKKIIVK